MTIQIDSREKAKAIEKIIKHFDDNGVQYYSSKLFVGDYMSLDNPRLIIDRKQSLAELCANVSDVPKKDENGKFKKDKNGKIMTERARFTGELQRAKDNGIKLVILCEHGGSIKTLDDVRSWINPRLKESPLTMSGERLYQVLYQMSIKYGFEIRFCDKRNTGKEIIKILNGETL